MDEKLNGRTAGSKDAIGNNWSPMPAPNITAASVIQKAKNEVANGRVAAATKKLVTKLLERSKAVRILNNINREIEDIEFQIGQEFDD